MYRLQSEAPRKRKEKSKKREKDANAPKRAATAFMLWLNENRKQIVEENPGIKVTEIAKKGGELWRDLKDKTVSCRNILNTHLWRQKFEVLY